MNLLGNAIKFTQEGEVALNVQLESKERNDCIVHFTVSDTGIGIAREKLGMIFDPFCRRTARPRGITAERVWD